MSNQKYIDEVLSLIDKVETNENKKIALAINKLKNKIKESTKPQNAEQAKSYVARLTQQALTQGTLIKYEDEELVRTKKSTQHKNIIQEVVEQFDVVADINNPALGLAWNRVKKSTSILELRTNLEMYIVIKDSVHKNDIQEYVDIIDEQDREIRKLLEYKRIQEELFGLYEEDDEDLKLLSDIENAKRNFNLSDKEVCKMFNCERSRLNRLRKKFELSIL